MTVSDVLLTVPEAAKRAGVSVRTMRRWASSGQVTVTGSGHDRRVLAASLPESTARPNGHVPHQWPPADTVAAMTADTAAMATEGVRVSVEADRLAALVRELTAENRELAAAAAVWQERARVLSDQLAIAAPTAPHTVEPPTESTGTLQALLARWWWAGAAAVVLVAVLVGVALRWY